MHKAKAKNYDNPFQTCVFPPNIAMSETTRNTENFNDCSKLHF